MHLDDHLQRSIASAVATKEYVARAGRADMMPYMHFTRGHDIIALVTTNGGPRDPMIDLLTHAIRGFDADVAGFAFEVFYTRDPQYTSSEDLAGAARRQTPLDTGSISEAVCVIVANRAGDVQMRHVPYGYTGPLADTLFWPSDAMYETDPDAEVNAGPSGNLVTALRHAMDTPGDATQWPFDQYPQLGNRDQRDVHVGRWLMHTYECAVQLLAGEDEHERRHVLGQASQSGEDPLPPVTQ